jgi:hypothetical protein
MGSVRPNTALFVALLAVLPAAASSTAAAKMLELSLPARLDAWQPTSISISIRGASKQFIVPVSLVLRSDAGLLMYWGIGDFKRGAERQTDGFYISTRWIHRVRGRRRASGVEVLYPAHLPQQGFAPRSEPPTDLDLLRITPLASGSVEKLSQPLVASYDHGGRIHATLEYIVLNPRRDAVCRVLKQPQRRPAFLRCKRLTRLSRQGGGDLHVITTSLRRVQKATAEVKFSVKRPGFDMQHARRRARTPRGDFAYDSRRKRWILVTPGGKKTLLVGARGPVITLHGDWLEPLRSLNTSEETRLRWNVPTPALAKKIKARLEARGIEVRFFSFKAHRSTTSLSLSIRQRHLRSLDGEIRRFGARLARGSISHPRGKLADPEVPPTFVQALTSMALAAAEGRKVPRFPALPARPVLKDGLVTRRGQPPLKRLKVVGLLAWVYVTFHQHHGPRNGLCLRVVFVDGKARLIGMMRMSGDSLPKDLHRFTALERSLAGLIDGLARGSKAIWFNARDLRRCGRRRAARAICKRWLQDARGETSKQSLQLLGQLKGKHAFRVGGFGELGPLMVDGKGKEHYVELEVERKGKGFYVDRIKVK